MIKRLKRKFILLSMTALIVLLAVIVAGMNLLNYRFVVEEADEILTVLSGNKGVFPEPAGRPGKLPPGFSPETPYESRYFSVFYDKAGQPVQVDVSRIFAVDRETALALAGQVRGDRGFLGEYRYRVSTDPGGSRVTFLDCGRRILACRQFLATGIAMSVLGLAAAFAVIFILAGRILRPVAESYEKQRRFITDAGHEIKTPLTVIAANAELLETELSENESLQDIKAQTKRLRTLTEELVALSRMEEQETIQKIRFPVSEVVAEEVQPFRAVAAGENKEIVCHIEPMLTLNGNDRAIRQLVRVFLDNAVKYSPPGGRIGVTLQRQTRGILLSVSNPTAEAVDPEQLSHVFERFYRTDRSRNSETGGYGIGLSIAKAIVAAHEGRIKATGRENTFTVTAIFP